MLLPQDENGFWWFFVAGTFACLGPWSQRSGRPTEPRRPSYHCVVRSARNAAGVSSECGDSGFRTESYACSWGAGGAP